MITAKSTSLREKTRCATYCINIYFNVFLFCEASIIIDRLLNRFLSPYYTNRHSKKCCIKVVALLEKVVPSLETIIASL